MRQEPPPQATLVCRFTWPCHPPPALLLLLLLLVLTNQPLHACVERTYSSRAVEQRSGVLLYSERYTDVVCNDFPFSSHVVYLGPYGDTLATKSLDFSRHLIRPDVTLDDRRTGYREGAIVRGDSIEMFRRLDHDAPEYRRSSRPDRLAAINAGLDHAIRRYWDLLAAGSRVEFDFAVPDRLRSFRIRVRRLGEPADTLQLRIEPASWWLRWVVPGIDMTYDAQTRRVLLYEGVTDMRGDGGRRYRARIEFDYGGPRREP